MTSVGDRKGAASCSIRVLCDVTAWHPATKPNILVAVFRYQAMDKPSKLDPDWAVERDRTANGLEVQLIGNEPSPMAGAVLPIDYRAQVRAIFGVTCPACKKRAARHRTRPPTYEYRDDTLYAALDILRRAGRFEVTVTELASIVQHMAGLARA